MSGAGRRHSRQPDRYQDSRSTVQRERLKSPASLWLSSRLPLAGLDIPLIKEASVTVRFERRQAVRRERPDLAPPMVHNWTVERYVQRLSPGPKMPKPDGAGWEKVGGIVTDKTWTSRWDGQRYVYGPCGDRVQHWQRRRHD